MAALEHREWELLFDPWRTTGEPPLEPFNIVLLHHESTHEPAAVATAMCSRWPPPLLHCGPPSPRDGSSFHTDSSSMTATHIGGTARVAVAALCEGSGSTLANTAHKTERSTCTLYSDGSAEHMQRSIVEWTASHSIPSRRCDPR